MTAMNVRARNRSHTDAVLLVLLDQPDCWRWQADIAEEAGLTTQQVRGAVHHLVLEYGAVEVLPRTKAVRIVMDGFHRYVEGERRYARQRLGENERSRRRPFIRRAS